MMRGGVGYDPAAILPVGTQVVLRVTVDGPDGRTGAPRGAVGVIVRAPDEPALPYRARFTGGFEAAVTRDQIDILKHLQREGIQVPALRLEANLEEYVIYRCILGSRAYGLEQEGSDVDRRGIYLPPAELHWSLGGVPEQLENDATQEAYWELQKFLTLALKANPTVLETLYTPMVETATPLVVELLANRHRVLSRLVYQTYNGYVLSQFKKLGQDIRTHGEIRWKHAMHLIRLLLAGVTALREGHVPVRVEQHREQLLAIRRAELPWEEVDAWRLALHAEFDAAYEATTLPERPDYDWTNDFLIRARRSMVSPL